MEIEFQRDMNRNCMIIKGMKHRNEYSLKMLINNPIKGLLPLGVCGIDNEEQYYYDITGKQKLLSIFESEKLKKAQIKKLLLGIINAVNYGKEYLLQEDDFVLDPKYIFVNEVTLEVSLCYWPGYGKLLARQLQELIHYFMNQIDYKDDMSVVFVYQLYQISSLKGYTFQMLIDACKENYQEQKVLVEEKKDIVLVSESMKNKCEQKEKGNMTAKKKAVMEEKQVNKKEMEVFPIKIYGMAGAVLIGTIIIFVAAYLGRNSFWGVLVENGQISIAKMGCIFLVLAAVDVYVLQQLFSSKNKTVKMKEITVHKSLIPPLKEIKSIDKTVSYDKGIEEEKSIQGKQQEELKQAAYAWIRGEQRKGEQIMLPEEETVLLSEVPYEDKYQLVSLEKKEPAVLCKFPFFIGKQKHRTNMVIDNKAISRIHGKIDKEQNKFFITDLDSTNGTYVNGLKINKNQRVRIHLGDEISFANVRYQFLKVHPL